MRSVVVISLTSLFVDRTGLTATLMIQMCLKLQLSHYRKYAYKYNLFVINNYSLGKFYQTNNYFQVTTLNKLVTSELFCRRREDFDDGFY